MNLKFITSLRSTSIAGNIGDLNTSSAWASYCVPTGVFIVIGLAALKPSWPQMLRRPGAYRRQADIKTLNPTPCKGKMPVEQE